MHFSLEVRRARKGDCLLLHYGTKANPRLMIIDAGPSGVYKPQLKPRIEEIRTLRGLDDADTLPVDVVMVSHVDDDHIQGILDLTKELRNQQKDQEPQFLAAATLWHNSFDDLLDTTPDELKAAGFGPAAMAARIPAAANEDELTTAMVLASIPQGRTLRDDATLLRTANAWQVNDQAVGKLILATKDGGAIDLDGGLKVTVVGPLRPELEKLQKEHDAYLKKKKAGDASAAALLAAYLDDSAANLSSIVVLVRAGKKSILLTGDARGDKIIEGLKLTGLLGTKATATLHVDILKVPHHGSANNLETRFFEQVTADHYVFSGNGEHGNPEREAIQMLFDARPDDAFTMHFTYPIDEIDPARKLDWEMERKKELAKKKELEKKGKKAKKVRPVWSAAKHGLRALLDADEGNGHDVTTIENDGEGQLIELLEKIKK